jgi:hypothetical protein
MNSEEYIQCKVSLKTLADAYIYLTMKGEGEDNEYSKMLSWLCERIKLNEETIHESEKSQD